MPDRTLPVRQMLGAADSEKKVGIVSDVTQVFEGNPKKRSSLFYQTSLSNDNVRTGRLIT
jgi:hypothetical protein